jgi:hypothetical protein
MITKSRPHPRNVFALEEDIQLAHAVDDLGTDSWAAVAARVAGRSPRQCRERWCNYLAPNVDNGPWTPAEEELLISKQAELGAAWKQISRFFPCRTDINIKSHWHQIQRRRRRASRDADPPVNAETVFDKIWKTHMATNDTMGNISCANWY